MVSHSGLIIITTIIYVSNRILLRLKSLQCCTHWPHGKPYVGLKKEISRASIKILCAHVFIHVSWTIPLSNFKVSADYPEISCIKLSRILIIEVLQLLFFPTQDILISIATLPSSILSLRKRFPDTNNFYTAVFIPKWVNSQKY